MISNPAARSAYKIAGADRPRSRKPRAIAMNGVTSSESGGVWAVGNLQSTVSFHLQGPGGS